MVKSLCYLNCLVRRWCAIAAAIIGRKRSKSSVGAAECAVEFWGVLGSGCGSGKNRLISLDITPIAQIKMSKKTNTKPIPENIRLIPSTISAEGVIIFLPYLLEKMDNFILIDLFK
jgi:hypothetical protein